MHVKIVSGFRQTPAESDFDLAPGIMFMHLTPGTCVFIFH